MTFDNVIEFVCENMPSDWKIMIEISEGCLSVRVVKPNGDINEPFDYKDELDILRAINIMRDEDGLEPIDWNGDHDSDWN